MLFVKSKTSEDVVDGRTGILLLEQLQERGLMPLLRAARLSAYQLALLEPGQAKEMEQAIATMMQTEEQTAYVRGDVFCFKDYALFLIIGNSKNKLPGMRAGIVYTSGTNDPLGKLDAFCRNVSEALEVATDVVVVSEGGGDHTPSFTNGSSDDATAHLSAEWQREAPRVPIGYARFSAEYEGSRMAAIDDDASVERLFAAEMLQDLQVRRFLHRIREAHIDNRVSDVLTKDKGSVKLNLNALFDANLIKREVVVNCRRSRRALFRMNSLDALTVLTASGAVCSECGALVADEQVEDLVAPTELASILLDNGSWLTDQFRLTLRKLGVHDNQAVVGPISGDGEVYLMLNVRGATYFCILKEEDWTLSHARRALDTAIEHEVEHIAVIVTGRIHTEARTRLQDYTARRAQSGCKVELIFVEGAEAAKSELQSSFERISDSALTDELSELDQSLGISIGYMLAARFRLGQRSSAPSSSSSDFAEAAVGATAGQLQGF